MKKRILASIFISLVIPTTALAAESKGVLYFSAPQTAAVGQNFTVTVMADPKGQVLDTVRAVVKFSKDTLEVKSVALSSAFSVADPDNFYSNAEGIISYAGGIPGGTAQLSQFAAITFAVKKAGNATVAFDQQSIMLSAGANMLAGTGQPLAFSIAEAPASPAPATQENTKPAAQNNSRPSPSANTSATTDEKDKNPANIAVAALEIATVPIVGQASSQTLNYLAANKWFFLFWLLLAADIIFLFRKKISALVLKYKHPVAPYVIALGPAKHELQEIK